MFFKEEEEVEKKDVEDLYKFFCIGLVIFWLFFNIFFVIVIMSDNFDFFGIGVSFFIFVFFVEFYIDIIVFRILYWIVL